MHRGWFLLSVGLLTCAQLAQGQTVDKSVAAKAPPAAQFLMRTSAAEFIQRFDKNNDGVLTRNEAPPFLAKLFDNVDTNQDGKLDRNEIDRLRGRLIKRFGPATTLQKDKGAQRAKKNAAQPVVDFDALDRNADGRLSRDELRNTSYASRFDEIDTNRDGQIDRREFEEFLKRETQKRP
jgi:Ca2+-binding EF-hand superfamily protein